MKLKKTIHYLLISMLILSNLYFPIKADATTSLQSLQKKTYYISYKVQKGDTLYSVAKKYHTTTTQIQKDNHLKLLSLKIGQVLKIQVTTYLPTIKSPTVGSLSTISNVNVGSYVVSGGAQTSTLVTLSFKDSKGTVITYKTKSDSKGKFYTKVNLSHLLDGKIILTAYQTNSKGVKSDSLTKSLFKDTIGPTVSFQIPVIYSKNKNSITVSGSSEANVVINLSLSDGKHSDIKKTVVTDSKGKTSTSVDVHTLNDGNITVRGTAKDKYGNLKTSTVIVTKDTITPIVTLNLSNISASNQTVYPVSGTTEAKSTVKIIISDMKTTLSGSVFADASGKFTKSFDLHTLKDETITIDVTSSDKSGNAGNKKVSVTKSTSIPLPPVISDPPPTQTQKVFELDAASRTKWNIYNDGTHPFETTKGINDALVWAHNNGYNVLHVPAGTYLISKGNGQYDQASYITMPSDMTLLSEVDTIYQKEANSYAGYNTLLVPMWAENVTIKGGSFVGDKDTHTYTDGANDGGAGIGVIAAHNITIDGVKTTNFTGDGMYIGGKRAYYDEFYQGSFEQGGLDDYGKPTTESSKVRLKQTHLLTDSSFAITHAFEIDNINWNFTQNFDVYFYKADGSFLSKSVNQSRGMPITIPAGAASCNLVFAGTLNSNIYMELHNKIVSSDIIIKNSESAFNRRQGITVGGANGILITNNELHDIKGTAPQAGIDVEGGFWENGMLNTNINVTNNNFYNNYKYNLVLYDGNTALVEGNHFKDAVGLAISPPFSYATVKNNDFNHSSIYAYHDVHLIENTFKYAYTYLEGKNIIVDRMNFDNTALYTFATQPYGIIINDSTFNYTNIATWNQPVIFNNPTMSNYFSTWRNDFNTNTLAEGSIYNNLKVTGYMYNALVPGIYNNCSFAPTYNVASPILINQSGTYTFNNCSFDVQTFKIASPNADVNINQSTFNLLLDAPAILIEKAKSIDIENSTIQSNAAVGTQKSVVMIGDDWSNVNPSSISKVILKGNTITSLAGVNGITSIFAGKDAPSYDFENNTLYNAKLNLKTNDINLNNKLLEK